MVHTLLQFYRLLVMLLLMALKNFSLTAFWKMVWQLPLGIKQMLWTFENSFFTFENFWVTKLKSFFLEKKGKLLKSKIKTWFWIYLETKTNTLSVWKFLSGKLISVNFWVAKLTPVFGKTKQDVRNSLNQMFVYREHFRKEFSSYLEIKDKCS